jgi:hypothetical protein
MAANLRIQSSDLWPLKPNLMGSAGLRTTSGSCRFVRHLPGLENGRFIGHARDRCPYRRCRRSDCACSGLFTVGAKGTQITPPAVVGLARRDHPAPPKIRTYDNPIESLRYPRACGVSTCHRAGLCRRWRRWFSLPWLSFSLAPGLGRPYPDPHQTAK